VYLLSNTMKPYFRENLKRHIDQNLFTNVGEKFGSVNYAPMVESGAMLLIVWLIALWMYRRRLFLKV
jgi:heparan-alpha-glucosaminide N-acetyltransferase